MDVAQGADTSRMVGPYRLEGLLGRGSMGEVHRAFDTRRGRTVALKLLSAELAGSAEFRSRFQREADSAARLQDPHVIPIHDFGEIDGQYFIDMRLVDGTSLDRLIAAGPLAVDRAVAILGQAAEALGSAHEMGIVHRDVKPSNLLLTRSDFVYLADFGIAWAAGDDRTALTRTETTIGTLAYMAPERFDGGTPDSRSDVYSLACVLAEMLTGRRPYDATDLPSLMKAHMTAPPPRPGVERPDVPPTMDDVIARGMAKSPIDRYSTTRDLALAARNASAPWSQFAASPVPPTLVAPTGSRHRGRLAGAVVGAIVIAAGCAVGGYAFANTSRSVPHTQAEAAATSSAPTTPLPTPTTTRQTAVSSGTVFGSGHSSRYTYEVSSNYPVMISYVNSAGDMVNTNNVPAPWTLAVDTAAWGNDARPSLNVSSSSTKGDTTVSCTIRDDKDEVVATSSRASAYAAAMCWVLS
ncbi:serine/threonine-protein kinase [Pseudonocardia dioxanivorans]|uniref:serine/threonine-protein kinase n=1 Tax=Pseudonocardia dioxanivorans TaxID=240495 RepID=UPI000CD225D3|nr:serine/threonine-protein kinase [Pseudonocardia dioxanivorans]